MTHQQLMRVYGALMWSLARILQNPEVRRHVTQTLIMSPSSYLGLQNLCWKLLESAPAVHRQQVKRYKIYKHKLVFDVMILSSIRELFEMEQEDLFNELQALPRFALVRRLNDLIKRAKSVKVRLLGQLTSAFHTMIDRSTAQLLAT